ncbi:hypothetical protein NB640_10410 [Oxalobacter vibrioformis]|uniref:Uncharacterized protein n=1 Tax=Oxalobacter vibrioformis TaxID=933080 RepID=A0A9E9LVJ4_9BURK|nr:hypothetical protein [Oxalobacter vibrioformis]WAW09634.1 hypothetical protein NB640_10410 [Oxalobacter vibrioformis]
MSDWQLKQATEALFKVLESQEGMIPKNPTGFGAAKFCTDFIDAYVLWLKNKKD